MPPPLPPHPPNPTRRELVVRNVRSAQAVKAPPPQPYSGVLDTIQCCGMTLTLDDLHTLEPSGWLNDQIINCYLKLILKSSPSKVRNPWRWCVSMSTLYFIDEDICCQYVLLFQACAGWLPWHQKMVEGCTCVVKVPFGISLNVHLCLQAKMNMLRLNLLLVPIHTGTHWSLAAIFAKKRVSFVVGHQW